MMTMIMMMMMMMMKIIFLMILIIKTKKKDKSIYNQEIISIIQNLTLSVQLQIYGINEDRSLEYTV
jgi:hypothetical protein